MSTGEGQAKRINFMTVLRNQGFRNLFIGQTISQLGDYFAFLAMLIIVSGFSPDAASTTGAVAGMMISFTVPRLLFGMLSGVFVDRWDRRVTMIVSDLLRSGLSLGLIAAFAYKSLPLMYVLGFALSAIGTFFIPAKGALTPKLVRTEELTAANSLSQTSMMLANFAGPALAGITFALAGVANQWVAFAIDSVSFVVSAAAIYLIRLPKEATQPAPQIHDGPEVGPVRRVARELGTGLGALFLNRTMATLAAVFAITMLGVGALNVLWVVFLKTRFGFNQAELAWRFSLIDIAFWGGMVAGGLVVGNWLSHLAPKWYIVWGLLVAGALTAPLGYLPDFWAIWVIMLLIGIFGAPINAGTATLTQIVVPNGQLGRVGGGISTIVDVGTLLSISLAGGLATLVDIPFVFFLSGVLCMAGGVLALVMLPGLTLNDKVEDDVRSDAASDLEIANVLAYSDRTARAELDGELEAAV